MAHLLVIEGWISESGNLILPLFKKLGHTYTFATRNSELYKIQDSDKVHPLLEGADKVIHVETNNASEILDSVKKYEFDGVITVCDYYFEIVREVADGLGVPCPVPKKIKNVRNKHLMRQELDKFNIPNAKYIIAKSFEDALSGADCIDYPLIVKPVDLASSSFVCLVNNEEELRKAYEQIESFNVNFRGQEREPIVLLEEYMIGDEVSVESVSFNGETTIIGITDKSLTGKPYFIENAHMFPAKISEDERISLEKYAIDVLNAVGFDNGISHMEVKLTKNGPRVVEINPRTPGNYIVELIKHVTEIELLKIFVELALGNKPIIEKKETKIKSASVMFIVPESEGVIQRIDGIDYLRKDKNVLRYQIMNCDNKYVKTSVDNDCYLGHIITKDEDGKNARQYAERAMEHIKLIYKQKKI